ncbi:MAG: primosomal protein N' [Bdellovibrionales bacterium RIFOXYD12_FULL_39_22]|nr:MAG: primosomal protein N' [Bdellovibrionales bacterium RIFOXYB1_FULL_39_21]OFZ41413.1 MAG: primosomal protein N' [Bdellovibrionales bacterium RIFOXYC12_FULL_39_17]OFZ45368.1 MAG: primosomal protein N' [Bdellovibrionales bacterium RIFOXYC1_FULL_39_130]OFZ74564.1 MAG: primosomal protein N' [Bdellovibrionales bacterium RIFOXYD1_FULL_39_84]OFZ92573.1 MAG: primosomal protein N' [Bdellovibrionales bacterium RIFOXYD12_FULL_39_22]HLE09688.1 primosomal protein N' [Bacteriovoracaceae bacterium]
MSTLKYCEVTLRCPLNSSILLYSYPEESDFSSLLATGVVVVAPLKGGRTRAVVLRAGLSKDDFPESEFEIKDLFGLDPTNFVISTTELEIYQWISRYYHYDLGFLIFETIPSAMERPRKLKFSQGKGQPLPHPLSWAQSNVVNTIEKKLTLGHSKWLIHGVTGSGKTYIYLELIKTTLAQGFSVLFLLPEINLTPQFIETFVQYTNVPIYSYNSSISESDRFGLWRLLQEDETPKLIIGVRSSVFLPVKKLGLIILDEEHDQSFKQEDRCPYSARDVALKKGSILNIPVIMGSATPSIEVLHKFLTDKAFLPNYFRLNERVSGAALPQISIIDSKTNKTNEFDSTIWPFNKNSIDKISSALEKNEQVLVFMNSLGYATFFQCRSCGHQFSCPNCSVNLKFFREKNHLSCQFCDYKEPPPQVCPHCQNMNILQKGFGTEKLQAVLQTFFPQKVVSRFDRDEITTMKKLTTILNRFHHGEVDILVGTQMLSKGHNFRRVNLVVILGIDSQLNFPDFRSNERVFQLLTQVSGRAGRYGTEGEVLVQSLAPDNRIFSHVQRASFDDFFKDELKVRELCKCAPFFRMAAIYLSAPSKANIQTQSTLLINFLKTLQTRHFRSVEILGPRPAFIEKKINKFTWTTLLRSQNFSELHGMLSTLKNNIALLKIVSIKIDVDPYNVY